MGSNEFDAHRALAGSRNAWAPAVSRKRGLSLATVVRAAGAMVAVLGALSAFGWV